ncbi:hypothetical protein PENTCL1PPCAC_15949, partial [Pristionchus entomophagus]
SRAFGITSTRIPPPKQQSVRCSQSFQFKRGSTSNLWRHMESKHPTDLAKSKSDFDQLSEKIVRFVTVENISVRVVDRPEFHALFPPNTRMPSRHHLSNVVMPSMVKKMKETIQILLTGKEVTLCVHQWTSKGGRITLSCFNAHYPNIKKIALKSLPIPATSVSAERVFSAA